MSVITDISDALNTTRDLFSEARRLKSEGYGPDTYRICDLLEDIITQQEKLAVILMNVSGQIQDLERDKHSHPEHYGN